MTYLDYQRAEEAGQPSNMEFKAPPGSNNPYWLIYLWWNMRGRDATSQSDKENQLKI